MRLDDFRILVDRLKAEIPPEYLRGVVEVAVSPKTVRDPQHPDVYIMGECIRGVRGGLDESASTESHVVLYHGSFAAMARDNPGFDWRGEAGETLLHELRHHMEDRAQRDDLGAFDWAVEQNILRHDGKPFDVVFYRDGERLAPGVFDVDGDVFLEVKMPRRGEPLSFTWQGRAYRAALPADVRAPAFLSLAGLDDPPPGEAVVVIPRGDSLLTLFKRSRGVYHAEINVEPADG